MADVVDIAQSNEQYFTNNSIREALENTNQLAALGVCRYCGEPIDPDAPNQRFCDLDCRDGYDYLKKRGSP